MSTPKTTCTPLRGWGRGTGDNGMDSDMYLRKSEESLDTAISEHANRRYNSCANRCYYACFQAAIAALLQVGVRPRGRRDQWPHPFVQAEFADRLVRRRHLYPAELRSVLSELQALRNSADYSPEPVSEIEATRALRRARRFVEAIRQEKGPSQ